MKILIAVDDSPHSWRAAEFAASMRWPAGSRMLVVSVIAPTPPITGSLDAPALVDPDSLTEDLRQHHEALVVRVQDRLRTAGFAVETRVLEGDPRDQLQRLAERESADLLVMGSHGRTGLARLLLGSVSSHAVAHAPCSVMVVKSPRARTNA